jgi:hypothetical protein
MRFKDHFSFFACFWELSYGVTAKIMLCWYYFQRILFKLGVFGLGEDKQSVLRLDNYKIHFNMRTTEVGFIKEIFFDQVYEREQDFIPQNGWVVLDLGANMGAFSLRNASRVDMGKIISFEPNYYL